MSGPPTMERPAEPVFVPHPDDEADVQAGLDDIDRGDVVSAEESAAYVRSLVGEEPPSK